MKLPEKNLFSGKYPARLKALAAVSIAWLVIGLVGSLYGLYTGIPPAQINTLLYPSLLTGLALFIAASGWKWRIDKTTPR